MDTDQVEVMPLHSFEYGGHVRAPRKGTFFVSRAAAEAMRINGQVRIADQLDDPLSAAGEQQPTPPAAPKKAQKRKPKVPS